METIASCAFGMEVNSIKEPDSMFLQKVREFFAGGEERNVLTNAVLLFLSETHTPTHTHAHAHH